MGWKASTLAGTLGSAGGTKRVYSMKEWRSSPRYNGGVKQENSPSVGEVINTTKHNVNTSCVLNNENKKVR
eukprot:scaffold75760_cov60-Cyclotella_meneghiniana.AAC.8